MWFCCCTMRKFIPWLQTESINTQRLFVNLDENWSLNNMFMILLNYHEYPRWWTIKHYYGVVPTKLVDSLIILFPQSLIHLSIYLNTMVYDYSLKVWTNNITTTICQQQNTNIMINLMSLNNNLMINSKHFFHFVYIFLITKTYHYSLINYEYNNNKYRL